MSSGVLSEDTYYGGVLVPAGAFVRQAEYAVACSAPECMNLYVLTPEQNAQIHDEVLNRGGE
ncbi:MAG: hypothetical protein ACE5F9_13705, partial [Phycisphaerae bacterium]